MSIEKGNVAANVSFSPNEDFFSKKEKKQLDLVSIDKVKLNVYIHNAFEFVETETRNILLCGRTRSGKTTTMGVLKDPCYSPQSSSIFSETQNPRFQSFSINNRVDSNVQKYSLNIIDSPGLFEVKDKDHLDAERTNEVIAQTIATCLENEITNIHCIIMFATFEAGINRDDIESMKVFLDMFGGCGVRVLLCITHADKHSDEWRVSIRDQLLKHPELASLIEKEDMPIMFMGCVDTKDKVYRTMDDLQEDLVSVYNMRKDVLELIFGAKEKRLLNQMNVAKKKIDQVSSAMDILMTNYKTFLTVSDFSTSKIQETMILHRDNIHYLSENSVYMNVPGVTDKFVQLLDTAKKFRDRGDVDVELKRSLLWPLKLRDDLPAPTKS